MEGFEVNSAPKPYTDEPQHRQSHERPELGLGFQSPTPVQSDLNPGPQPPPGDLDPQFANEERRNQKVGDQEIRNRQAVEETLQNQQPLGEEPQNQQSVGEELQNQEEIEEGFQTPQSDVEEVLNEQTVNEELQNLVLEEREKVSEDGGDSEGDVGGAKSEGDEKGTLSGVHFEGGDGKETDDGKGSGGADKGNEDNNGSENEKNDDDDNNENVGEEIRVGGGLKEGRFRRHHYPLRPDADDCSYYMRHGTCKFGPNCKFNHPLRRRNQEQVREKDENSEKPEQSQQTECKVGDLQMQQYYLSTGGCKFGDACRFNHSGGKTPVPPAAELNFVGLPIRPGKKECPFYMRNGSCKYGSNCRFNHPDPTTVGGDAHSGYGNGGSVSLQGASQSTLSWPSPRALNETGPFVPVMFSPTKNLPSPTPDWNYQAPLYTPPERSLPTPPAFALSSPAETNSFMHHKKHIPVDEFPERPGQPECSYFLKTGDCKYRSGCKFHHPKNRIPKTATCALSDKGLPLRPDQNICSHYSRYGICKFGPACKFDHPINYGHSASSAVSGPDVPSAFRKSRTTDGARAGAGENGNDTRIQQPVYE